MNREERRKLPMEERLKLLEEESKLFLPALLPSIQLLQKEHQEREEAKKKQNTK